MRSNAAPAQPMHLGFRVVYGYDALARLPWVGDGTGRRFVTYIYDDLGGWHARTRAMAAARLPIRHCRPHPASYQRSFGRQCPFPLRLYPQSRKQAGDDYHARRGVDLHLRSHRPVDAGGLCLGEPGDCGSGLAIPSDAAGNRLRVVSNGAATDYVANNLNQYTRTGAIVPAYDADGNTTAMAGGRTASYDEAGRVSQVSHRPARPASNTTPPGGASPARRVARAPNTWPIPREPVGARRSRVAALSNAESRGWGWWDHHAGGTVRYPEYDLLGSLVGLSGSPGSHV